MWWIQMGVCLKLAASDVVDTNEIVVFYRKQKKVEFKKKLIMEFVNSLILIQFKVILLVLQLVDQLVIHFINLISSQSHLILSY